MIFQTVIILLIVGTSLGETPTKSCLGSTPFKNKDNKCSDFMQICAKTEDPDCQSFLTSCEQCPPSNITNALLMMLSNTSKHIQNMVQQGKSQTTDDILVLLRKSEKSSDNLQGLLIAIIIILCILVVIILAELRFKLITKCTGRIRSTDKDGNYSLLESRKEQYIENLSSQLKHSFSSYDQNIGSLKTDFERKFDVICDQVKSLNDKIETLLQLEQDSATPKSLTKFILNGRQVIELHVGDYNSIVKVKRLICHEIPNGSPDTYKIMKLRYKGHILDDNRYLLDCVESRNVEIHCEIDKSIDPREIIILRLQGSELITNLIQIQKYKKIKELKPLISEYHISIFKETEELPDDLTVEQCNLTEKDLIKAIKREHGTVTVDFILEDISSENIEYSNTDKVSSLVEKIKSISPLKTSKFYLFSDGEYMAGDRMIFEFPVKPGWKLKCLSIKSFQDIKLDKVKVKGISSEIFSALEITSNRNLFLRKFEFRSISKFLEGRALLSELSKIFVTKHHPLFGSVYGLYIDGNVLYVEIDYLKSMSRLVKEEAPFEETVIAKWSKQILDGLKYLHDNNIVYRDLKASDILLDDDRKIKISGFGLSKYLHGNDANEIMEELVRTNVSSFSFSAPEVMNDQPFGKWTDVWSFGVILLNIVTGKALFSSHSGNLMEEISNYKNIECESPNVSTELKAFIDCCLKGQPRERCTVLKLLENPFIKKYN